MATAHPSSATIMFSHPPTGGDLRFSQYRVRYGRADGENPLFYNTVRQAIGSQDDSIPCGVVFACPGIPNP